MSVNSNIKSTITKVFEKYKSKFTKPPVSKRLSEYEKAFGFTEKTRLGSKQFSNQLGYFMEDVYNVSPLFNKIIPGKKGGNDGYNNNEFFECKNRFDTMKQSMAVKEITPRLEYAISHNKEFKLLILNDKNFVSQNIPLHRGCGLVGIRHLKGYDPKKHRWISGDEVYKHIFKDEWKEVKEHILELLKSIKI